MFLTRPYLNSVSFSKQLPYGLNLWSAHTLFLLFSKFYRQYKQISKDVLTAKGESRTQRIKKNTLQLEAERNPVHIMLYKQGKSRKDKRKYNVDNATQKESTAGNHGTNQI